MEVESNKHGGQHRGEYVYDSFEEIQNCLKCTKPECTNCLEYKKGK